MKVNKSVKSYFGLAALVAAAICLYAGARRTSVGLSIAGLVLAAAVALASLVHERPGVKSKETGVKM